MIKKIGDMSKYFSGHQVFRDWIEVYALSIANCCEPEGTPVFEKREQQYLSTINKYEKEENLCNNGFKKGYACRTSSTRKVCCVGRRKV